MAMRPFVVDDDLMESWKIPRCRNGVKTAEKLLFERSLRARDIAKGCKQLRENIFCEQMMALQNEATEWLGSSQQACHIAFAPLIIGFRVRGDDQVRSRVRQTKMMKIATTIAPAIIQY